ncbi:hypothetical protein [Loktanella agnita]|uniref:hypothetical protein n=1 Tax=Loktanella agnita TaxID=287097 RepID=UPI00398862EB
MRQPQRAANNSAMSFANPPYPRYTHEMTNTLAIILGIFIIGFIALDIFVIEADVLLFLARKFVALTEYLAFWR